MSIKGNKLAKNYIFNVIYKILNIAMPLITAPYLSRTVGAEGVGTYAYYYAIAHYFYIFGKMGLNNYGAREIAMVKNNKEKKNYTFSSIYYQQLLVTIVVLIIYIFFCSLHIKNNEFIPMILGLYTIGCLIDVDWLYTGGEKFSVIAIKNIAVKIISLVAIFLFVKTPADLWTYTLIMSLGMLFGFISLWFGIKKEVSFVKVKVKDILKHLKPNLILLFPVLAANIYHSIDKVMVGNMYSMTELGYYDNAEKIVYGINGFITAFTNIMMPKCSNLIISGNSERCKKYITFTMDFLLFIILFMGSVCGGISETIVSILFGYDFIKSATLLRLLVITLPFMVWSEVIRAMWVIPNKKDKVFLVTLSIGAILDFIFNLILIPYFGAIGACIGTIIAEMSVPITQFFFFKKELKYSNLIIDGLIFIISSTITILTLNTLQSTFVESITSIIILSIIGLITYLCITSILFLLFRKKIVVVLVNYLKNNFKCSAKEKIQ